MQRNKHFEQLLDEMQEGKRPCVGILAELVWVYYRTRGQKDEPLWIDFPIDSKEDAAILAQELSLAGVNEIYIIPDVRDCYKHRRLGDQFLSWLCLDRFGLKLRGIELIENPKYDRRCEETADNPQEIAALRFSFSEEKE